MKKIVSLIIVFACLFSVSGIGITAYAEEQKEISATLDLSAIDAKIDSMLEERDYVPGQIIFRTKKGLSRTDQTAILKSLDMVMSLEEISKRASFEKTIDGSSPYFYFNYENGYFVVSVAPSFLKSMYKFLATNSNISFVSLNYIDAFGPTLFYDNLSPDSGSNSEGYDIQTTLYAMMKIGVKEAWAKGFVGSDNVKIAIVDTGYNQHVDIDCVVMSEAYNTYDNNTDVTDHDGHGTFITGIIGAELNALGINGVAQHISIVPIKAYHSEINALDGEVDITRTLDSFCGAMMYAQEIGADIVNVSSSLPNQYYLGMKDLFDGLVVLSAGNEREDITYETNRNSYMYYAREGICNDQPNWLVVGASDYNDQIAVWENSEGVVIGGSNYSNIYVDLFAPGSVIRSFSKDGEGTERSNGTSFSAPYVAVSAAVIMSHATQYRDDPEALIELLCSTVDQKSCMNGKCVSGGRLSLINAVEYLYTCERPGEYSKGDVNNDGYVTAVDATLVKGYVMNTSELSSLQLQAADIDGNGIVNTADYVLVRKFVNQTNYFPPS